MRRLERCEPKTKRPPVNAEAYSIEKILFTEADFDRMSWHDAPIHAFALGPADHELSLDVDYIYRWIHPLPGETYYKFWLGPATLAFERVYDLKFDLHSHVGSITLFDIKRSDGKPSRVSEALTDWLWVLDCLEGEITFRATGFRQFARGPAILTAKQKFTVSERGGYGFECPPR